MWTHARAGIIVMMGALVLGGRYIVADGTDAVPGIFTFKPPLSRVTAFPTPKAVSSAPNQAPLFDTSTASDPAFFENPTHEFVTDHYTKNMKISWWTGTLDGVELASVNPDLAPTPVSTTKLFTAAVTLHDFRSTGWTRTVVAWGESAHKLYLVGRGDILLGTGADTPEDIFGYAGLGTLAANAIQALTKHFRNTLAQAPYTLMVGAS